MPIIRDQTDMAIGATAFPLQGSQYEFLPFDAVVEFAILADGTDVNVSVSSGSDILQESAEVDQLAVATPIQYPEDFTLRDVAAAGERLGVRATNDSGAARILRTVVRITPL